MKIENDTIKIALTYNKTIDDDGINLYYEIDNTTYFKDVINVKLETDFPFVYCQGEFPTQSNIYGLYSKIISPLYLLLFVIAFISYNKIMAV